jgi:hypothetical protein
MNRVWHSNRRASKQGEVCNKREFCALHEMNTGESIHVFGSSKGLAVIGRYPQSRCSAKIFSQLSQSSEARVFLARNVYSRTGCITSNAPLFRSMKLRFVVPETKKFQGSYDSAELSEVILPCSSGKRSPFVAADSRSASQDIFRLLWILNL